jgi:hypothetical protein
VGAAGVTFGCAALLEIAVDTAWTAATGAPCWEYRLWPVHQGHTSRFGVLMWPMYGAFVQHFHGAIRRNPALHGLHGPAARAVLVAVEAMVLEILANALSLGGFGSFLFYYLPDDLGHLTTFRIFLPYVAAGAMGVALLGWLERQPRRAEIGVAAWVLTAFVVLSLP